MTTARARTTHRSHLGGSTECRLRGRGSATAESRAAAEPAPTKEHCDAVIGCGRRGKENDAFTEALLASTALPLKKGDARLIAAAPHRPMAALTRLSLAVSRAAEDLPDGQKSECKTP